MTTVYCTATSLDGFIADPDNSLEWLFAVDSGSGAQGPGGDGADQAAADQGGQEDRFGAFMAGVGALAMGATTYLWLLDHERVLDEPSKWTAWYADRPTWVFTHRDPPVVPGADIRFVSGDVRPVHAAMVEAAAGRDVWLAGGGELVGQFADHGLLDEVIVSIAPVTLGGGAPLLPRRLAGVLQLVGAEVAGQMVEVRYAVGAADR